MPLLIISAVGAYAVQFGIMGFQPHFALTDEGDYQPAFSEPSEAGYDPGLEVMTNESELTVNQTSGSDSSSDESSYVCVSDDRQVGTVDMSQEIVQLNEDRERGDPLYYRVDHTGAVVVENSNREVHVREYSAAEDDSSGSLLLGLRKKHGGEPESTCKGELSFNVSIRYDHDVPDMRVGFDPRVEPPANETAD